MKPFHPILLPALGAALLSTGCFSFRVGSPEAFGTCEWVSSSRKVETLSTSVSELEPAVVPDDANHADANVLSVGLAGKATDVDKVEDTYKKVDVYRQRMMTFGLWPAWDELPDACPGPEEWKSYWEGPGVGDILGPTVGGLLALPVSVFVSPFYGSWECSGHAQRPGYYPDAAGLRNDIAFHSRFDRKFAGGRSNFASTFLHYTPFGFHRFAYHYVKSPAFSRKAFREEKRQRPLSAEGPYRVRLELPEFGWSGTVDVPSGRTAAKFRLPEPDKPAVAQGFVSFLPPHSGIPSPEMQQALDRVAGVEFPVSVLLRGRALAPPNGRTVVVRRIHRIPAPEKKRPYDIETVSSSGGRAEYRVKVQDKSLSKIAAANLVLPEIRRNLREDFLRENPEADPAQVRAYVTTEYGKGPMIVLRGTALSFEPVLEGLTYEPIGRIGTIRIRVRSRMDAASIKSWATENIGAIVEDKNVVLEVGKAPPPGATYRSLGETFENGVLTVEFEAVK